MYTSIKLIDMVKAVYGLPSDYAVSKKIGCSRNFIYDVRKGRRNLGFDFSLKCAELLELDPLKVISGAGYEIARTKNLPDAAELWSHYA